MVRCVGVLSRSLAAAGMVLSLGACGGLVNQAGLSGSSSDSQAERVVSTASIYEAFAQLSPSVRQALLTRAGARGAGGTPI